MALTRLLAADVWRLDRVEQEAEIERVANETGADAELLLLAVDGPAAAVAVAGVDG